MTPTSFPRPAKPSTLPSGFLHGLSAWHVLHTRCLARSKRRRRHRSWHRRRAQRSNSCRSGAKQWHCYRPLFQVEWNLGKKQDEIPAKLRFMIYDDLCYYFCLSSPAWNGGGITPFAGGGGGGCAGGGGITLDVNEHWYSGAGLRWLSFCHDSLTHPFSLNSSRPTWLSIFQIAAQLLKLLAWQTTGSPPTWCQGSLS